MRAKVGSAWLLLNLARLPNRAGSQEDVIVLLETQLLKAATCFVTR